jgi:hypothetical protein
MDVPALHEAEHLAGQPAHLQRLAVERAGERVERAHDVGDGAVAVAARRAAPRWRRPSRARRVGLAHHLLAEVDPDQVVLEQVVVEHVLGRLAEVDDPLGQGGGLTPNAMFCA